MDLFTKTIQQLIIIFIKAKPHQFIKKFNIESLFLQ